MQRSEDKLLESALGQHVPFPHQPNSKLRAVTITAALVRNVAFIINHGNAFINLVKFKGKADKMLIKQNRSHRVGQHYSN